MGKLAIKRPVTVTMFTIFYIALGIGAYLTLTRDLFPNIHKPALKIITEYEGAASKEIEEKITKKLEEELGGIKGLQKMKSYSGDEKSEIVLEFDYGTNLDFASIDIREKLDQIKSKLPKSANNSVIERFDPSAQPIIIINISSLDKKILANLRYEIEQTLKVQLERIKGVASVKLSGGNLYEISLKIDGNKLRAYKLSLKDVQDALKRENISLRGGRLSESTTEFLVRTVGKFRSLEDIKNTVVSNKQGVIYIKDILAFKKDKKGKIIKKDGEPILDIDYVPKKRETLARLKTYRLKEPIENIQINIFKKPGTNTIRIAEDIKKLIEYYRKKYKKENRNIQITVTYDQSVYIKQSLDNIKSNAVQGIILAVIILLIFLRSIESTIIIAISMPISVIAAFSLFPPVKMGLNLFSMAGLTLAVGMVVDNAIVVIEAIFSNMKIERRLDRAILISLTEIGPAVFSSTLTTLAVFVPILFVKGFVGQIFRDLSYTIVFTLIFSLIVAFTFIPMLIYQFLGTSSSILKFLNSIVSKVMDILFSNFGNLFLNLYSKFLEGIIKTWITRLLVIIGMTILFILSIVFAPPSELLPETPEKNISIQLNLPAGLNLGECNRIGKKVEKILSSDKYIKNKIEQYTERISLKDIHFILKLKSPNTEIISYLRNKIKKVPDIKDYNVSTISPIKTLFTSSGGDIVIKIGGLEIEKIKAISKKVIKVLKKSYVSKYLTDIQNSMGEGKPEILIIIDKNLASDHKITTQEIAENIEMSISGKKVTSITLTNFMGKEEHLDIRISLANNINTTNLGNLPLKNINGEIFPLRSVAKIILSKGPSMIIREERERIGIISANIKKGTIALGELTSLLSNKQKTGILDKIKLPPGYSIKLSGSSEAMKKSFSSLKFALIAAVILVYMVMSSQFESLLYPFAIMFSIPLSVIGASFGLILTGKNISITAFIGLIMLAGIVVNNAIILIDYINILRARGYNREDAILKACRGRMRPIFMTTLTTVLGMLPMGLGIGEGSTLYQPLAIVVISGLSFATFLTLVFIPTIYCFFDDVKELIDFIIFKISIIFERE